MRATYLCLICGKEFEPIRILQKYCSIQCKNKCDKDDRRFSGVRDYVIGRDGQKCTQCGSQEKLIVHHEDWIRTNNDPSNLKTLCRSCHAKEHGDSTDLKETKLCAVCGGKFHPLHRKIKIQVLCQRKTCSAKWKALTRPPHKKHEDVACIICGKIFMQKHPRHFCCGGECTALYNDRKKAERYASKREELRAKQIRYYQENKEVRKAYIKQWQVENPEKVKAYKAKNVLKHKAVSM